MFIDRCYRRNLTPSELSSSLPATKTHTSVYAVAVSFLGGFMSGLGRYLRIVLVFSLFASTGNLWAQATAQISGTAKHQSGAVLPGAEIKATQTETGIVRSTVTKEAASYVVQTLPIGPYKLDASLPGFRTYSQTGIVLQVDSNPTINVTLQ